MYGGKSVRCRLVRRRLGPLGAPRRLFRSRRVAGLMIGASIAELRVHRRICLKRRDLLVEGVVALRLLNGSSLLRPAGRPRLPEPSVAQLQVVLGSHHGLVDVGEGLVDISQVLLVHFRVDLSSEAGADSGVRWCLRKGAWSCTVLGSDGLSNVH